MKVVEPRMLTREREGLPTRPGSWRHSLQHLRSRLAVQAPLLTFIQFVVLWAMVVGCQAAGKDDDVVSRQGCTSNDDCKGNRICVDGVCVSPPADYGDVNELDTQREDSDREPTCAPNCQGKECGDDYCGGLCGQCQAPAVCNMGMCTESCFSTCEIDGCDCGEVCGEWCGECPDGLACVGSCKCECAPDCSGRECGDDGCGGSCGECAQRQEVCFGGQCSCQAACEGKECGDDGCGGICGECTEPQYSCVAGECICQPACEGKECGNDGCSGTCGECSGAQNDCIEGECVCQPTCGDKECGDDGCGGQCGFCNEPTVCSNGKCVESCFSTCETEGCDCGEVCDKPCGECTVGYACADGCICVGTCPQGMNCSGIGICMP